MKEDFSMFDENDDVSMHAMRKPKTMDNNCVNLQCLNNRQKLVELKDKYNSLQKKYFQLEKSESNKCEEYNDLLNLAKNLNLSFDNIDKRGYPYHLIFGI